MDLKELKKQVEQITKELKSKASGDTAVLVDSLSFLFSIMLETSAGILAQNERLTATITDLQENIKELRRQLNMDSHNSSKPPSSDGYKKPNKARSLRKPTGRKPGGQNGHSGANMKVPHEPDEVKKHHPDKCMTCPHFASCAANGKVFECGEKRFIVEAVVTTKVIEHQSMKAVACPCGESKLKGEFPEEVKAYVQYGDTFRAMAGLLSTFGAVSTDRIQTIIDGMFNVTLSEGTICSMVEKCGQKVTPIVEKIKELLIGSSVVNFDETGVRVEGSTQWVHNSSNAKYTYLTVNKKRGQEGIEDNGVIQNIGGTAVHDCWGAYWKFKDILHAVCCAHLLRELIANIENNPTHVWTERFKTLLITMKTAKEKAIEQGKTTLSENLIKVLGKEYDEIMAYAEKECPPPDKIEPKKRGKKKKGKERALIDRLIKLKDSVCLFIHNFLAPIDNNQAERDLRNVKTKANVSGCFRTKAGAQTYLKITSYLSTAKKHGINAFEALALAFKGETEKVLI
ncbi:IS66 family transposase [Succinivibrio sp.]|uniref:IS66 family transposase n=1 Tax=Succinivibrio sp. TaxID=2053619 RepID=UPI0025EE0E61|nr:IS66 family transposase [Succinivibrio sp.]MBQ9219661.1 IS66 family transposase [Succinivibrio sp.]